MAAPTGPSTSCLSRKAPPHFNPFGRPDLSNRSRPSPRTPRANRRFPCSAKEIGLPAFASSVIADRSLSWRVSTHKLCARHVVSFDSHGSLSRHFVWSIRNCTVELEFTMRIQHIGGATRLRFHPVCFRVPGGNFCSRPGSFFPDQSGFRAQTF